MEKHIYNGLLVAALAVLVALGIYARFFTPYGERWTPEQIGSFAILLLAFGAAHINNFRNRIFHRVVAIFGIVATWTFIWMLIPHRDFLGMIASGIVALFAISMTIWLTFRRTSSQQAEKSKSKLP